MINTSLIRDLLKQGEHQKAIETLAQECENENNLQWETISATILSDYQIYQQNDLLNIDSKGQLNAIIQRVLKLLAIIDEKQEGKTLGIKKIRKSKMNNNKTTIVITFTISGVSLGVIIYLIWLYSSNFIPITGKILDVNGHLITNRRDIGIIVDNKRTYLNNSGTFNIPISKKMKEVQIQVIVNDSIIIFEESDIVVDFENQKIKDLRLTQKLPPRKKHQQGISNYEDKQKRQNEELKEDNIKEEIIQEKKEYSDIKPETRIKIFKPKDAHYSWHYENIDSILVNGIRIKELKVDNIKNTKFSYKSIYTIDTVVIFTDYDSETIYVEKDEKYFL